ncbi:MAG: hypothetical protein IJ545_06085 [Alphaproteobacteria bacterium]|nr:hypothetical protein [Alphaproteobacteria bacterium]
MTKIYQLSEQKGRSMVEMLGVLAIVGVLSIGGISGYSKAMAKYKINKTVDQVSMLITSIRTAFGNQNSYYGLTTEKAINYDLVGNDLTLGSTSTLTNAYSGSVTIAAKTSTGAACSTTYCPAFSVTYTNLDRQACAVIASSDWGGSAASGLYSITINSSTHTWNGTANTGDGLPIGYDKAMSECSGDGKSKYVTATIMWTYY